MTTPYAYVGNSGDGTVSVISTAAANQEVVSAVEIGVFAEPQGVAATPDGAYVYVTNHSGDTVSVIDTAVNTVAAIVHVGNNPLGVAVTPGGAYVYVANVTDGTVSVIATANNMSVETIRGFRSPWGVAVTPDGTRVYVTNDAVNVPVSVIDTATNQVTETVEGSWFRPQGVAVTPDGAYVYVTDFTGNTVSVIETALSSVVATVVGVANPLGLAVTPDGAYVYVACPGDDPTANISVISTATNQLVTTVGAGFEGPTSVAVTPDGEFVYVVCSPPGEEEIGFVSVIATATNQPVVAVPVGPAPCAAFGEFIAQAAPVAISSISPPTGSTLGGTEVYIQGSGFDSSTGIYFGNMPAASWRVVDDGLANLAVAYSPPADAGPVDITVRAGVLTSAISPADVFTYVYLPGVGSIDVSSNVLWAGETITGTVTLDEPAGSEGVTVTMDVPDPAGVTVPASVVINPGETSATFPITASATVSGGSGVEGPGVAGAAIVYASGPDGTENESPLVEVYAGQIVVILPPELLIGPGLVSGETATGTIVVRTRAPASGGLITLSASHPDALSIPASVPLPGGGISATFTLTALQVSGTFGETISASYEGNSSTSPVFKVIAHEPPPRPPVPPPPPPKNGPKPV